MVQSLIPVIDWQTTGSDDSLLASFRNSKWKIRNQLRRTDICDNSLIDDIKELQKIR
jgi:hypothetical protein